MQLVLIRHGKAEDHETRSSDDERELTAKGRKKVEDAVPGLKVMVNTAKPLIWSSPLPRARQTADILAKAWGGLPVREYNEIQTGDLDGLIRQWEDVLPDITLIIVGHEPYLSDWAYRIAGIELPFKLATAAGFTLENQKTGQGELSWFAHAKVLAAMAGNG